MDRVTQSALLKALGWSLFDSLWQMALLWLFFILLVSVFSKMTARSRHGLALVLIGAGAGAFVLSFIFHYVTASDGSSANILLSGLLTAERVGYALPAAARQFIDQLLPYCSFLYLLALAFLFARYTNHYFHSRRLKAESLSRIDPSLRVFVTQTALRMGIKKEVGVWLSSLVEGPVTLGFLRPVILIPFATVNNLSLDQIEAILLHELAHIKRYDYLLNLGVTFLRLLFFFNPFARLLIRHIRVEREHCCDDLVMQFRYDPRDYVTALLSLARAECRGQALALAATGKNDRFLLQRVKRILKQENRSDRPETRLVIFFLFTVLASFLTLSHPANPVARMIQRSRAAISVIDRVSPPASVSKALSAAVTPFKKPLALTEKSTLTEKRQAPPPPAPDAAQHDQLADQEMQLADNPDMQIEGNSFPVTINILTNRLNPPAADTTLSGRLLAALTDEGSSAREVKANIIKAIAVNKATIRKAETLLNGTVLAIRKIPSAGQRPAQTLQRRALEEQIKLQSKNLSIQKDLQKRLESAARKLTIVDI